jgi:Family of unknown function (DUF6188)
MSRRGELGVTFTSTAKLVVPPDPRYEAWSLGGFVCLPGCFSLVPQAVPARNGTVRQSGTSDV